MAQHALRITTEMFSVRLSFLLTYPCKQESGQSTSPPPPTSPRDEEAHPQYSYDPATGPPRGPYVTWFVPAGRAARAVGQPSVEVREGSASAATRPGRTKRERTVHCEGRDGLGGAEEGEKRDKDGEEGEVGGGRAGHGEAWVGVGGSCEGWDERFGRRGASLKVDEGRIGSEGGKGGNNNTEIATLRHRKGFERLHRSAIKAGKLEGKNRRLLAVRESRRGAQRAMRGGKSGWRRGDCERRRSRR